MTITELSRTLPNGFYDSELYGVSVDYVSGEANLRLGLLMELLPSIEDRENVFRHVYKHAKLMLSGVEYLIVNPPQHAYEVDDAPMITSDGNQALPAGPHLPELEQPTAFRHWFFVGTWNAVIYLAAAEASIEWE